MNLEEFYRQAHYFRDYTPVVTPVGGMTLSGLTVTNAKYLILGRLVIGLWDFYLTVTGVTGYGLAISTPTLIGGNTNGFAGSIDANPIPVPGFATYQSTTQMLIKRYDSAFFVPGVVPVSGVFFYQNGEPVV